MARAVPTVFVVGLLAATAVAFAAIERVKLERSPITDLAIERTFSPVCRCPQKVTRLSFRLRKPGRLTISIVDRDNRSVRTLIVGEEKRAGKVRLVWNGRDDAGALVADGFYRVRLHVLGQHRAVIPPNGTTVDTSAPRVRLVAAYPAIISPDGDSRGDTLNVRYSLSKRAHALIRVNGRVQVEGRPTRKRGTVYWGGKVDGRSLPAGWYRISVQARDAAGNLSLPTKSVRVRIRYIDLSRRQIETRPGALVRLRVITDAARIHWRIGDQQGTRKPGRMAFHAPSAPGRYPFIVEANGRRREALVIVNP